MTELKLRTGGATHRGAHRDNNEDSMVVAGSLCVVADGMGGHEAGEVASRLCVRQLAHAPFFTLPGGRSESEQAAYAERIAAIKAVSSWSRGDLVMKNGWATMPGTTEANSQVAKDCADKISA